MSVASLEDQYPYLRGHVYTLAVGSRSGFCAFCGAFRSEHPADRQGSSEPLSRLEVQETLAAINRKEGRS